VPIKWLLWLFLLICPHCWRHLLSLFHIIFISSLTSFAKVFPSQNYSAWSPPGTCYISHSERARLKLEQIEKKCNVEPIPMLSGSTCPALSVWLLGRLLSYLLIHTYPLLPCLTFTIRFHFWNACSDSAPIC
jgi:hypothetical protein